MTQLAVHGGVTFKTLDCEACGREATESEWNLYVGRDRMLRDANGYRWAWFCGCTSLVLTASGDTYERGGRLVLVPVGEAS